ncbi:hypothetical protein AA101099_1318 [Neoasaia chiangmaiensis NBRC 101099]|uniref:Uncharacterized protein n=1 Tax=Neoasaia chiangmaiensis TaxID=320497 RepID=A0A1U9KQG3_9PROT|nr:hypothetical protein [Neoasaia chiangmaiensis]AQS88081.1 hypothetical protein A0U93_09130 [Neoasaia chiangmaiensis]GBR38721.1 hypothetical protein AA101099_1318 [Neoasaia chiangmaiensis NBRC 101099]GEN15765.1 hypothetical protein NCH01_21960 [Neoasaia chiangmaiensis]
MFVLTDSWFQAVTDNLVLRAGLAQTFDRCAAARAFWETHLMRLHLDPLPGGPPPECMVRLDERPVTPIALVVSGRRDTACDDFDLSGPFLIVTTKGTIERCESCLLEIVSAVMSDLEI